MESFNEKLAELKRLRKKLINKENDLEDNMKKEKSYANKAIEDKYIPEIENIFLKIEQSEEEINEFNEEIVRCSTFDIWDIVQIMKEIIKIYEGETYIYKQITYTRDSKRNISSSFAKVLFSDKRKKLITHHIDISKLYSIQKNGDGIILDWNDDIFEKKYINFYSITDDGKLKSNIKLSKFPYLKQFIDFVISYEVNNNYEKLNFTELQNLKYEFIVNNVEEIEKYHETITFNEQINAQKEIDKKVKYRNKQLIKAIIK